MDKKIISSAAVLGVLSIIFGAFGAHALKEMLSPAQIATFETGVKYQMYNALFLLFIGSTILLSEKQKKIIFYLTITGIFLFSGSIYLLATSSITKIDFKLIGIATPIGGFLLITAWFLLFINILKNK